jgi:hypothetical protein
MMALKNNVLTTIRFEDVIQHKEARRRGQVYVTGRLSGIGTLDNNLPIWDTEGGDPESGLLEDTHMQDVADFDGNSSSS